MANFRTKDTEVVVTFAGEDITQAMIKAAQDTIQTYKNLNRERKEKGNVCAKVTPKINAEAIEKALVDYVYSLEGVRSITIEE